jgi:hypothetical protein
MFFPISNTHINPVYLAVVGFIIGILGSSVSAEVSLPVPHCA